jgi:hypothetical protein
MKRRQFLANSLAAGAAAVFAPSAAFGTSAVGSAPAIAQKTARFSRAWFEKLVNSDFRIETPDGSHIDAKLVAVSDRGSSSKHHQFSAVFRLPAAVKAGGLCWIDHPSAGRFQLHLDDSSSIGSMNLSQAQFNLVV